MSVVMKRSAQKPFWYLALGLIGLLGLGWWLRPSAPAVADGPLLLAPIQWSSPELLSTTSPNGAFSPVIRSADNGHLMLMFNQVMPGGAENPYYRRSTNGGTSWSAAAPVFSTALDATEVDFVYDHNNMAHAVFRIKKDTAPQDYRILYTRESQWPGSATTLANPAQESFSPAIAVGPNNALHVVWSQVDNQIWHTWSQNGGTSWSSPAVIANATNKSDVASVTVDSNNHVHVVWEERIYTGAPWHYEIHYKKGTVSGSNVSWQANPTILSGAAYDGRRPAILAEGLTLHVGFSRQEVDRDQFPYYTRYSGGGWSPPIDTSGGQEVTVNTASPFFLIPNLTVCNGNVYMYYHGAVTLNAAEQILGGTDEDNWEFRDEATDGSNRDIYPAITCAGGNLHLAFARVISAGTNPIHQVYYISGRPRGVFLPMIFRGS
jgi:hypothetical protein